MSKIYFCSFADSRFRTSLDRIKKQANKFSIFDKVFICDEYNLDKRFRKEFKSLLSRNVRGFGYWVWKPQIILQVLDKMQTNDILLYIDAGCHLNIKGEAKLNEYLDKIINSKNYIMASELEAKYSEKYWTKFDLLQYLNSEKNEKILNTAQIQACVIFIKKSNESVTFFNRILNIYRNQINLVNDTESKMPNFDGFIEHRHDQSIFSVLSKQIGIEKIPNAEIYTENDWSKLHNFPILAKRDKWSQPQLPEKIKYKLINFYRKIFLAKLI